MIECGAFEDMRVELVAGVIEKMAPAYGDHGARNAVVVSRIIAAYGPANVWVAVDLAIQIDELEVRGADIAVVPAGIPGNRLVAGHETLLLVEIANSTLGRDLGEKVVSYGRAGVPEYWVVDLPGKVTHVFTQPNEGGFGSRTDVPFDQPLYPPWSTGPVTIG